MKKPVVVVLGVVALIALVLTFHSGSGNFVKGEDLKTAVFSLQQEGYSDIKVINTHYVTAIPPGFEPNGAGSCVVGALDSFTASAQKSGKSIKLRVRNVGQPTKVVEEL